jgi:predicted TIM-barrel fold metal-dependent hydrolase
VAKLIAAARERRVPVMLHWEVYDWARDWPAFDALYGRFPDVTFIWPHAGFASAEQVGAVLAAHPNVVVTLSKKETPRHSLTSEEKTEQLGGPAVDDCGRLLDDWRALFLRHPDRFLFATDAHKSYRWAGYAGIVAQWRSILGQLPAPVAESIAWRNAERLYDAHPPLH